MGEGARVCNSKGRCLLNKEMGREKDRSGEVVVKVGQRKGPRT